MSLRVKCSVFCSIKNEITQLAFNCKKLEVKYKLGHQQQSILLVSNIHKYFINSFRTSKFNLRNALNLHDSVCVCLRNRVGDVIKSLEDRFTFSREAFRSLFFEIIDFEEAN